MFKKILLSVILIFYATFLFAQFTNDGPGASNTKTLFRYKGGLTSDSGYVNLVYSTLAAADANSQLKYYNGATLFIEEDSSLYVRLNGRWIKQARGSGSSNLSYIDSQVVTMTTVCFWKNGIDSCYDFTKFLDSATLSIDSTSYDFFARNVLRYSLPTLRSTILVTGNGSIDKIGKDSFLLTIGGVLGDGVISPGRIDLIDSTIIISPPVIFRRNDTVYTISNTNSFVVNSASPGFYRTDIVYIGTDNLIHYKPGLESTERLVPPSLDPGEFQLYVINVFGNVIDNPGTPGGNFWSRTGDVPSSDTLFGTLNAKGVQVIIANNPRAVYPAYGGFGLYGITTAQMNAIVSPADGVLVYNLTDTAYYYSKQGVWTKLGSSAGGSSASGWSLTGDTVLPTTYRFGSLNDSDIIFIRNNIQSGILGTTNTSFGNSSLPSTNTGTNNTAIGQQALNHNTTGISNTSVGGFALISNTTGGLNNAFGSGALFSNTTGGNNTSIGNATLQSNISGGNNTAVGPVSLTSNTTGSNNIGLGNRAGANSITGSNQLFINSPDSRNTYFMDTAYSLVYGVMNDSNYLQRFKINGYLQLPLGAANGYVLTSNSTGIATWQPSLGSGGTPGIDSVLAQQQDLTADRDININGHSFNIRDGGADNRISVSDAVFIYGKPGSVFGVVSLNGANGEIIQAGVIGEKSNYISADSTYLIGTPTGLSTDSVLTIDPISGIIHRTNRTAFLVFNLSAPQYVWATAGQTTATFTGVDASSNNYILFKNGIPLEYITDFTASGNVLTFAVALALNDRIRYQPLK